MSQLSSQLGDQSLISDESAQQVVFQIGFLQVVPSIDNFRTDANQLAVTKAQKEGSYTDAGLPSTDASAASQRAATHHRLGVALQAAGRLAEAATELQAALAVEPDDAKVVNDLGCVYWADGKLTEALKCFEKAVRLQPDLSAAHNNLGCLLKSENKLEAAIASYQRALELKPEFPHALNNLGCALKACGETEEAMVNYRRALALKADFSSALSNLGSALQDQGEFAAALEHHYKALAINAKQPEIHYNLASTLHRKGDLSEAQKHYDRAIELRPAYADAHFNRAIAWLAQGKFAAGWREYEWRWKTKETPVPPYTQPVWDGHPMPGKTLLLHTEQGLGDAFQFIRYAPIVRQRFGGKVVLRCAELLRPLLSRMAGIDRLVTDDRQLPKCDVRASLMSLPGILGDVIPTPPADVPYLFADPALVEHWQHELPDNGRLRVGIAWQGNPKFRDDRWRSIPLAQFERLAELDGAQLISLQKGTGVEQIGQWNGRQPLTDLSSKLDEKTGAFMDTAAVIINLDLVITSDSAIAHLAGALGVPVWLALAHVPEWRWMMERTDSPWYPTMRLFRQPEFGNWDAVFTAIASELEKVVQQIQTSAGEPPVERRVRVIQHIARQLFRTQQFDRSLAEYAQALQIKPADFETLYRIGLIHRRQGRSLAAAQALQKALQIRPTNYEAWNDYGCALSDLGRRPEAGDCFRQAILLAPTYADAHNNLGCELRAAEKFDQATISLQRAVELRPAFAEAWNNLGNAQQDAGEIDSAVESHRRSLELRPNWSESHNGLGAAFEQQGSTKSALEHFNAALQLEPGHAEAHLSRGLVYLRLGHLQQGWPDFEWRLLSKRNNTRRLPRHQWKGEPLAGRRLLIHAEQGFGDTLQFVRYARLLQLRDPSVLLEVQPHLVPLLRQSGFQNVIARGEALPQIDVHVPLLSLPRIFNTSLATIPGGIPYLRPDPLLTEKWAGFLDRFAGFRIGISWQGSPTFKDDWSRSIPLRQFARSQLCPTFSFSACSRKLAPSS